jgi:predicted transcriptional regulator
MMPMILPEELASKSVIPAIRALIVKRLVEEHGMTQQEAAKHLGVTQPAVSKYLHQKRGASIRLGGIREIDKATGDIADMVSSRKVKPLEVMSKIEAACEYVKRNRYMCDLHKRLEPGMDIESCHICEQ